ncbi:MAG: M20 family metallopeptidase, partial [bacterium]
MDVSNSNLLALSNYFVQRRDASVAATRALVETESPSGDAEGSRAVVDRLVVAAQEIGGGVKIERITAPNYGEHLRLTAFAETSDAAPLMLLGHTDTVHPRGSIIGRAWRVEGSKAYGPGVFDMKANCVLALEIIRALSETGLRPPRPVVLLLTCDEETGSLTGRTLVETEARSSHAVLVLEPSASEGRAKTGRKGTGMFTIEARGIAAHAGLDPEKGASAILELARQTEHLNELNGWSDGININVGVFHGGTLANVVAAEALIDIDARFSTMDEAERVEKEMLNLRRFDDRVQLIVKGGINRPPLERTEKVLNLYRQAKAIAEQLGFELGEAQVGGASDGNFAAAVGASVLDGLGIAGDGAHAPHEHIVI